MNSRNLVEPRWFHIAVQALVVIARSSGPCASATISRDVEAHAVFLRRVLAQLVRAGILQAQEGRAGGYRLARPAKQVTLAEVFIAVKLAGPVEEPAFASDDSACVQAVMGDISDEVEGHIVAALGHHSLADVIERAAALRQVQLGSPAGSL